MPTKGQYTDADVAGTGQGETPNYGADTQVVNPTLGQIGKGALREGANLLSGGYAFGRGALEHIPGVKGSGFDQAMQSHQATLDNLAKPQNMGEAMGQTGAEMASYLAPAKAETAAVGAAEKLPSLLRPVARIGTSALSGGIMSAANRHPFSTGAIPGAVGGAVGEGLRPLGVQMMRSALPGTNSATAREVLDTTSAIRPSTLEGQVRGNIGAANQGLDALAARNPNTSVSLFPADSPLALARSTAERQRVPADVADLTRMQDFLRGQGEYGPPRLPNIPLRDALDARRGFSKNFVSNNQWKQVAAPAPIAAAKQSYGGLTGEIHNVAPESIPLDETMHNLIPAETALKGINRREPSIAGNVMGRMGARTGALTSTAMGAAAGANKGLAGAILGGGAGMLLPEVLSTPVAKNAIARTLYSTAVPKIGRAAAIPLVNYLRERNTGGQ